VDGRVKALDAETQKVEKEKENNKLSNEVNGLPAEYGKVRRRIGSMDTERFSFPIPTDDVQHTSRDRCTISYAWSLTSARAWLWIITECNDATASAALPRLGNLP
jgi:hypothetical protein